MPYFEYLGEGNKNIVLAIHEDDSALSLPRFVLRIAKHKDQYGGCWCCTCDGHNDIHVEKFLEQTSLSVGIVPLWKV